MIIIIAPLGDKKKGVYRGPLLKKTKSFCSRFFCFMMDPDFFWRAWPVLATWLRENRQAGLREAFARRVALRTLHAFFGDWVLAAKIFPPPLVSSDSDEEYDSDED